MCRTVCRKQTFYKVVEELSKRAAVSQFVSHCTCTSDNKLYVLFFGKIIIIASERSALSEITVDFASGVQS